MKNILTIIKKELTRVFTDRRMILSLFLLPPLSIFLIYGLMGVSAEKETTKVNEYAPTVYIVHSPEKITMNETNQVDEFVNYVNSAYQEIYLNIIDDESQIEDLIKQVDEQKIDLLIVFSNEFENNIITKTNPNVDVHYNVNNSFSQSTFIKFQSILGTYSNDVLNERIGDTSLLEVFSISAKKEGNIEKAQGQILSMILPMLIVIFLMAGAMGVGIESISGEKERGTIATLLVTPIKRSELAIGKIISISLIGLMSSLASFIGLVAVLPTFAKIDGQGGSGTKMVNYGPKEYFMLLTIMLVAVLFFVTLIVIISSYAKTVKEAGTLIMPFYLLVMGGAMFNMFSQSVDKKMTSYVIPVYNIILSLKAAFGFELYVRNWLMTIISTIVYTLLLIFVIQKMFKSEKIMFNR